MIQPYGSRPLGGKYGSITQIVAVSVVAITTAINTPTITATYQKTVTPVEITTSVNSPVINRTYPATTVNIDLIVNTVGATTGTIREVTTVNVSLDVPNITENITYPCDSTILTINVNPPQINTTIGTEVTTCNLQLIANDVDAHIITSTDVEVSSVELTLTINEVLATNILTCVVSTVEVSLTPNSVTSTAIYNVSPSSVIISLTSHSVRYNLTYPVSSVVLSFVPNEPYVYRSKFDVQLEVNGPGFVVGDIVECLQGDYDSSGVFIPSMLVRLQIASVTSGEQYTVTCVKYKYLGVDQNGDINGEQYRKANNTFANYPTYFWKDFWRGAEFVRIGNVSNKDRQGSILLSSVNDDSPYIDIYDGVADPAYSDPVAKEYVKVRLGNLNGITDNNFGSLSGYGIYTTKGYFKGNIAVGSASALEVGTGAWLTSTGTFRVGNPSSNYLKFDGTDVTVKGTFKTGNVNHNVSYGIGLWADTNGDFRIGDTVNGDNGYITYIAGGGLYINTPMLNLETPSLYINSETPYLSLGTNNIWTSFEGIWMGKVANSYYTLGVGVHDQARLTYNASNTGNLEIWGKDNTGAYVRIFDSGGSSTAAALTGWNVDEYHFYDTYADNGTKYIGFSSYGTSSSSVRIFAGATNKDGANAVFSVTSAGALTATNATIIGAITAQSGSFNGTITATDSSFSGTITNGIGDNVFKADSNGIYLGSATFASAPFKVTMAGALTASSGTIGDWIIDSGTLTGGNGNVTLDPIGKITVRGTSSIIGDNFQILNGDAYFKNIRIDGTLGVTSFAPSKTSTLGGSLFLSKGTAQLGRFIKIPNGNTNTSYYLILNNYDGLSQSSQPTWDPNDIIRIKDGLYNDTWFQIDNTSTANGVFPMNLTTNYNSGLVELTGTTSGTLSNYIYRMFDGDLNTYWEGSNNDYFCALFNTPRKVSKYKIYSFAGNHPIDWTIQAGSLNSLSQQVLSTIDTVTGQEWSTNSNKTYRIDYPIIANIYKFNLTASPHSTSRIPAFTYYEDTCVNSERNSAYYYISSVEDYDLFNESNTTPTKIGLPDGTTCATIKIGFPSNSFEVERVEIHINPEIIPTKIGIYGLDINGYVVAVLGDGVNTWDHKTLSPASDYFPNGVGNFWLCAEGVTATKYYGYRIDIWNSTDVYLDIIKILYYEPYKDTLVVCKYKSGTYNCTYPNDVPVVNYGQSTSGVIEITADSAIPNLNYPYISLGKSTSTPWTTLDRRVHIGNLKGLLGKSSEDYGIIAGNNITSGTFKGLLVDGTGVKLYDIDLQLGNKTSYSSTSNGMWFGYDSTAYKFNIGDDKNFLRWTGSKLEFSGQLGSGGVLRSSDDKVFNDDVVGFYLGRTAEDEVEFELYDKYHIVLLGSAFTPTNGSGQTITLADTTMRLYTRKFGTSPYVFLKITDGTKTTTVKLTAWVENNDFTCNYESGSTGSGYLTTNTTCTYENKDIDQYLRFSTNPFSSYYGLNFKSIKPIRFYGGTDNYIEFSSTYESSIFKTVAYCSTGGTGRTESEILSYARDDSLKYYIWRVIGYNSSGTNDGKGNIIITTASSGGNLSPSVSIYGSGWNEYGIHLENTDCYFTHNIKIANNKGIYVNSTKVLGNQQNHIANATDSTDVVTKFNTLLSALEAHGILASS